MVRCTGCARHVRPTDGICPFCARPRAHAAHKALQFMGGVTTTVVLAACYGGFDDKSWSTGYVPTPGTPGGTPTSGPLTGTATGTTTFAVTVTWTDVDGGVPEDTDANGVNDANCNADTLEIDIADPLGAVAWDFGVVEQGVYGWRGEDCGGGSGAFVICHAVEAPTDVLTEVCVPGEVVGGATTLFDASKDPYLTYYLSDGASCFVWGADVAYYATLGCTELL